MVVDCFDALTSDRPYRPRFETAAALQLIIERRGTMYDPRVVDVFVALHEAGLNEVPPETRAPVIDPHAMLQPHEAGDDGAAPKDLAAFYALGRELAAPATGSQVGEAIWKSLRTELNAAACVLFVYDDGADALRPLFRIGVETVSADARIPLGERLSGWVAATATSILNSDARLDLDPDVRDRSQLQSALAVPIDDGQRIVGVLAFYSARPTAFTSVHQRRAEAVAALVAARVCATQPEGLGAAVV
jgi:GAF domain-containing protein